MKANVILFLMFSTLVGLTFAAAAPQNEFGSPSSFLEDENSNTKAQAEFDSLSVTPIPNQSYFKDKDTYFNFGKRLLAVNLIYFNGIAGDKNLARSSLYLINLESSFRSDMNRYHQFGAAFSESNGVFFHASELWILKDFFFAKPFWRVRAMTTSSPNQTFSSIFNYKNLNLGLGYGIKDIRILFRGAELSLDVMVSSLSVNYLIGFGYEFGF